MVRPYGQQKMKGRPIWDGLFCVTICRDAPWHVSVGDVLFMRRTMVRLCWMESCRYMRRTMVRLYIICCNVNPNYRKYKMSGKPFYGVLNP